MLRICNAGLFVPPLGLALALALAGCGAPRPRQAASPTAAGSVAASSTGKVYRLDENQSELRVLVYRAGPLAHLGHNHVMVNRSIRGSISLTEAVAAAANPSGAPAATAATAAAGSSAFSLSVPVTGFVVDDAEARREEGSEFAAEVPDDARRGTLLNMLSTSVLDADEFPLITISGVESGNMKATVVFNIAGHESKIDVPYALRVDTGHLVATGTVEMRQTALGLTPFSLMLGALQVQDAMTIKFKIVADL
ncbi:MAG: YceI family protein [Gammaproteobacteria bacterium]